MSKVLNFIPGKLYKVDTDGGVQYGIYLMSFDSLNGIWMVYGQTVKSTVSHNELSELSEKDWVNLAKQDRELEGELVKLRFGK